jgi:hypothetical protein
MAEVRAVGSLSLDQIGDIGDVLNYGRRHAPADGAGDDRFTELEAEKVCRIDPWVDAGDHEQPLVGKERKAWRVVAHVAGREGGVASTQRIDVGHVGRSVCSCLGGQRLWTLKARDGFPANPNAGIDFVFRCRGGKKLKIRRRAALVRREAQRLAAIAAERPRQRVPARREPLGCCRGRRARPLP